MNGNRQRKRRTTASSEDPKPREIYGEGGRGKGLEIEDIPQDSGRQDGESRRERTTKPWPSQRNGSTGEEWGGLTPLHVYNAKDRFHFPILPFYLYYSYEQRRIEDVLKLELHITLLVNYD